MTLTVLRAPPAIPSEWDRIWNACTHATYFHSRHWSEIWSEYNAKSLRPAPVMAVFSDGLTALLPFTNQTLFRNLLQRTHSSPGGTYGGWISECDLTEQHANVLRNFVWKNFPNLYWRQNPYCSSSEQPHKPTQRDTTYILDLDHITHSAAAIQNRGHRSAISKAIRQGITVHRAESASEWEAYYRIYQASLDRWGKSASSSYSREFFSILHRHSLESNDITLWLAKYLGSAIAGAICLSSKNIVVYWHGAALEEHFDKRPVNLLMTRIIEQSAGSGKRWFDFNPSGGHEGVSTFKSGFGASPVQANIILQSSLPIKIFRAATSDIRRPFRK